MIASLAHLALAALLLGPAPPRARCCDTVPPPHREVLALVLSGGGARGLAHIGVLRALDSLGIRPDLVVGTSIGALVGAMYASGMTGRQIDSVARTLPLERLFRREPPRTSSSLGPVVEPIAAWDPLLVFERRAHTLSLQNSVVREPEIDALVNDLLLHGNLTAAGDFDRLPIPFRAVATDLRSRDVVLLGTGDLARAVRASFSIPGIFTPVVLDGRPLVDGGVAANVPVREARELGATRVIVSDASSGPPRDSAEALSSIAAFGRMLDLLLEQPPAPLRPGDVRIRPDVSGAGLLDFSPATLARLVEAGRVAATDSLRDAVASTSTAPATSPASAGPPAASPPAADGAIPGLDSADVARIGARLRTLEASGRYAAVWLNPSRADDAVAITPVALANPTQSVRLGLGYDNQNGGHAWATLENVGLLGGRTAFSGAFFLGETRRLAQAWFQGLRVRRPPATPAGRTTLPDPRTGLPPWQRLPTVTVRFAASARAMELDIRRYDDHGHRTGVTRTRDALAFLGAEARSPGGWFAAAGAVAHGWSGHDSTWSEPPAASGAVGGLLRVGRTLSSGAPALDPSPEHGAAAELLWTQRYQRAQLDAGVPARIGTVALRASASLGWGRDLPAIVTFPLGGDAGFPGLRPDERRGDRMASALLTATRWIGGPVYGRIELGAGSATRGGTALPTRDWILGAGVGGYVSTPLGSLGASYGWTTLGHGALLLRIGER